MWTRSIRTVPRRFLRISINCPMRCAPTCIPSLFSPPSPSPRPRVLSCWPGRCFTRGIRHADGASPIMRPGEGVFGPEGKAWRNSNPHRHCFSPRPGWNAGAGEGAGRGAQRCRSSQSAAFDQRPPGRACDASIARQADPLASAGSTRQEDRVTQADGGTQERELS